jgi:regulator of protease activity HflC (stomatin/prohibitin superfamily)
MTNQLNQNQFYRLTMLVLSLVLLAGCTTRIGPGMVGIEVDQSGSQRGVQDLVLKTGRVWYNPYSTSVIEYPTYMQSVTWTADTKEGNPVNEEITFNTKDSMTVRGDFNLSYTLLTEKVPAFYIKFRNDDLAAFNNGFLHSVARTCINDTAGSYNIEQIMGDNGPWLKDSEKCLNDKLDQYGVKIEQFGIIGSPRPPDTVIQSINMKVQATQLALQKQNEVAQAQAEAKKAVAVAEGEGASLVARAKGEAEANRIKSSSIDDKLISWYKLNNQHDMIWRWDGQVSKVQTGNSGVLLQLPNNQ